MSSHVVVAVLICFQASDESVSVAFSMEDRIHRFTSAPAELIEFSIGGI